LKRVTGYLISFLVAYLAILILVRLFEKSFVFFPQYPGRESGDWQPVGLPVEEVWLTASDGVKLHAWWIPGGGDFTFVAFHGNAGNITHRSDIYGFLRALPANVLAVEYRGYGRSAGSPDEEGIYRDAQAAYDYLVRERGIAPRRIISFGQSLGTAVAADLAANREVGGVVLEAPFPSALSVAKRVYWFLPGLGLVTRTRLATAEKLARVSAPVLVVHCVNDPVIAFALGEEVFRAARDPKELFRVDGYCHEETYIVAPDAYRARLRAFLGRL
jgi:fermentation-respiration switch protein FrsA (DUF1100 family)